jgi:filamentous hemagglutinin family protein
MPIDRRALRAIPAAVALALCATGAAANPQGGVVKAGSATITPNGSRIDVIQSSPRAVIDWRSFSIGTGGHVDFKQPSAASATLNRVTGPQASAILGRLTANGTVFLVNPNGILIGPGAKIDVGGLVAATANISNENFMAGRYKFDEVVNRNAVIVNRGEITAQAGGLVALVAPGVQNSGVIRAELGRVVLASGNRFTLDLFGDKLVAFAVDDKVAARLTDVEGRPLKAYVNQTGRIEADGGSILIAASAAKAVLDNVINTGGVVRATSFAQRGGEIVLHGGDEGAVRVAGTLDASGRVSGASGGNVKVLGAEVVMEAGSRIAVAGDAGGGTALVGGGVQGGGGVPRSLRTTIEAGATVNADALANGNGGTVVAWSDGETRFAGALSARGGPGGGDGGFVEVSGKRELAFAGAVDVAAPAGKGGLLLLDPAFLVVDAATAAAVASTLRSGASAALAATDTVDVRQRIDGRGGAAGGGLALDAGNAITVNNDIVTNDGAVVLRAGAGGIVMGPGGAGSLTGGNGTVVHAGAAPITLAASGSITAEHLVTTGAVSATSTAGTVTVNRDLGGTVGAGIASLNVAAGRDVLLNGVNVVGPVDVRTLRPGGTITLAGPIASRGGSVMIGNSTLIDATTIRLEDNIHTRNADVDLYGRVLVNPRVVAVSGDWRVDGPGTGGRVVVLRDPPDPWLTQDGKLFENVLVQVSLQTTGGGSVRLHGDTLWDYAAAPNNAVRYFYNRPLPPGFQVGSLDAFAALRREEPVRSTGYYGLNIGVESGGVTFGGKLGMYNSAGGSTVKPVASGALDESKLGNGLFVSVNTLGGQGTISFGPESVVTVSRFRHVPLQAPLSFTDVVTSADVSRFGVPPKLPFVVMRRGNLPFVPVRNGNPNAIGPGPNNVAAAASFARLDDLPEVVVSAPPARAGLVGIVPEPSTAAAPAGPALAGERPEVAVGPASQVQAAASRAGEAGGRQSAASGVALREPTRAADLGRGSANGGAAQDVFEGGAPLVPHEQRTSGAADGEYFSQGAFEFAQTLSERAQPAR